MTYAWCCALYWPVLAHCHSILMWSKPWRRFGNLCIMIRIRRRGGRKKLKIPTEERIFGRAWIELDLMHRQTPQRRNRWTQPGPRHSCRDRSERRSSCFPLLWHQLSIQSQRSQDEDNCLSACAVAFQGLQRPRSKSVWSHLCAVPSWKETNGWKYQWFLKKSVEKP